MFRRLSSSRRSSPALRSPPKQHLASKSFSNATVVLTSDLGEGGTGIVHGGQLFVNTGGDEVALNIAVKLSFNNDQQDMLRDEYLCLSELHSRGVAGIPTVLGYYDSIDENGPTMLVMLNAGVDLDDNKRLISDGDM